MPSVPPKGLLTLLAEQVHALHREQLLLWCRRSARCESFEEVLGLGRVTAFLETLERWLATVPDPPADARDVAALDALWRTFTDVFPVVYPDLGGVLSRRMLAAADLVPPADRATLLQENAGYDGLNGRPFGQHLAEAARLAHASGHSWVCWSVPYTGAMAAISQERFFTARRYVERAARLLPGVPGQQLSYPSRFRRSNPTVGTARLDGDISSGLGFPHRAQAPYRRALAALRRDPQPQRVGYLWFACADLCWRLGHPSAAERRYRRVLARSRAQATRDTELEINALARLAVFHWELRPQREEFLSALLDAAAASGSARLQSYANRTATLTTMGAFRQRLRRRLGPPAVRWPPSSTAALAEQVAQCFVWWGAQYLHFANCSSRRVLAILTNDRKERV